MKEAVNTRPPFIPNPKTAIMEKKVLPKEGYYAKQGRKVCPRRFLCSCSHPFPLRMFMACTQREFKYLFTLTVGKLLPLPQCNPYLCVPYSDVRVCDAYSHVRLSYTELSLSYGNALFTVSALNEDYSRGPEGAS